MTAEQRNGYLRELGKYALASLLGGGIGGGISGQITVRDLDRIDARVTSLEARHQEVALRQAGAIAKRDADTKAILDQLAEIKAEIVLMRAKR
jgi:hypothetical protein